jgi:hypothetical protein
MARSTLAIILTRSSVRRQTLGTVQVRPTATTERDVVRGYRAILHVLSREEDRAAANQFADLYCVRVGLTVPEVGR